MSDQDDIDRADRGEQLGEAPIGEHMMRRGFLTGAAATAGVVATGAATKALAQSVTTVTEEDALEQTAQHVVAGLSAGDTVGVYRIRAIHPIRLGGLPVVLEAEGGEPFQVDVLRRDTESDGPAGVFETDRLAVFVANWGDGSKATDESQGLGARALGRELARRGCDGELRGLLTWRERNQSHPDGVFTVPID